MWGYWSSPMMYGQNAIVVNEFLGHSWRKVINLFLMVKKFYEEE